MQDDDDESESCCESSSQSQRVESEYSSATQHCDPTPLKSFE